MAATPQDCTALLQATPAHVRDWVDYLQAFATPVIALAGVVIAATQAFVALGQWKLNQAKQRFDEAMQRQKQAFDEKMQREKQRAELFTHRLQIFDAVREYLSEIARAGTIPSPEAQQRFNNDTRGALFVFDQPIADFVRSVWVQSTELEYLKTELSNPNSAENRGDLAMRRRDAMNWVVAELQGLRERFALYMVIQQ